MTLPSSAEDMLLWVWPSMVNERAIMDSSEGITDGAGVVVGDVDGCVVGA